MKKFEIIKRDFGTSDEDTTFELPLNMTVANPDPEFFDEEERLVLISRLGSLTHLDKCATDLS
jgi:streptogramin lyase